MRVLRKVTVKQFWLEADHRAVPLDQGRKCAIVACCKKAGQ
jgi:hypothetical protein